MRVQTYATRPMPPTQGWQAKLDLAFAKPADMTVLVRRQHHGPLVIQRPFYPEGEVCHVYLLHPPGGVVGGDVLQINIAAESSSHALLTTPAVGKFYRSAGLWAAQTIEIDIDDDAAIEWLPQETIVYQGAQLKSRMKLNLSGAGRFIGWELFTLGRPASGEGFNAGAVDLNWHIAADGKPLLIERLRLDQNAFKAKWGLQNFAACGTLFAKPAGKQLLTAVQTLIGDAPYRGVTLIDDILVCRALDQRCDRLRAFFEDVYTLLRPEVIGKKICTPRIWAT
ncbi:MAG: urease accessory protein UreD [Gammaproteobacteria bacterium]|nr:urease accessory protein UreD [Gammaproteobacteria bacterium]